MDEDRDPRFPVPPERSPKRRRVARGTDPRRRGGGEGGRRADDVPWHRPPRPSTTGAGDGGAEAEARVDPRTDEVAREAAGLLDDRDAASISEAIEQATNALDAWDAPRPSRGRIREHARALAMQRLGEAGYAESVRAVLREAEEIMTVLEHELGDETRLVGRAARGQIDAGVVVHVRVHTDRDIGEIAEVLVAHDLPEPEFEGVETRVGKLDRIRFEEDGVDIAVIRVPPELRCDRSLDLVTGKRIESIGLDALRELLGG